MRALVWVYMASGLLSACSGDERSTASPSAATIANANATAAKALPFNIENAMLSDAFQHNLKLAKVEVGVSGGSTLEWAATSIAIAEALVRLGADSVEVSVRRNEITQTQGVRFREVTHTYYSPNPSRSVWGRGKSWQLLQADATHLATQQDVAINDEFDALNQKFIDKGMDLDAAEKKAGSFVAKKFHLAPDWRLPGGEHVG
ncbi:hypothetical protein [Rugamonas aquatica]|uniref:Uncharacterized protein n=1 Tax=Rugamonas aquatica TaxID=2743357 RepID=A0A6A7N6V3_9BURK|nr:hypothetical protein [Rugamonas aquatica]MQA40612.1 hypothetical protein [Rugamonas aquatica]